MHARSLLVVAALAGLAALAPVADATLAQGNPAVFGECSLPPPPLPCVLSPASDRQDADGAAGPPRLV